MPIDTNIALQVRPLEIGNPLAQFAQMSQIQNAQNQNALAQYQLGAAKREENAQNALSSAYQAAYDPTTGTYDMNKLRGSLITAGVGARLPAVEETMAKLRGQQLAQQKTEGEVVAERTKQFRDLLTNVNNPAAAAQWLGAQYKDPFLGPIVSRVPFEQAVAQIPTDPVAFNEWVKKNSLGMGEFIKQDKPHFVTQDLNGRTQVLSIPGMGGAANVVPGSAQGKTLTPGEARAAAQESRTVAHTITDEAGNVKLINKFGQVITPTAGSEAATLKGKPSATFEKIKNQREQLNRDLTTAISEIKNITEDGGLIDQSTGSGLGRARDVTAGFFGKATEGAIAAAKLKPIADLALKMVPRFEGPQSDKDTQSYKEAAGQLADSSLPSQIRKEAGKTVLRLMENRKGQFVTEGMATEGIGAGGGVDTNNPLLAK